LEWVPGEAGEKRQPLKGTAAVRPVHAWLLRQLTRFVEVAQAPSQEQLARMREWEEVRAAAPDSARNYLFHALLMTRACLRHQAATRTAAVALGVERYRQRTGAWPETLAALVPGLLHEIPTDPYDGAPLRYRRLADGVVIYAVGSD